VNCDSQYKFYGPHLGALHGEYDLLDRLRAYKVRPAPDAPPGKFETGTQNHEGIAGTLAAVEYLVSIGERCGASYEGYSPALSGATLEVNERTIVFRGEGL
jgi:selenocysteine lyase/cysteine desulfurase